MLLGPTILAILSGLSAVSAQSTTSLSLVESTLGLWPTGISEGSTSSESTLPLACAQGCLPVSGPYFACFVNVTQSGGGISAENQGYCDDFFCSQGNYTQLLDCANCIVANGDERPFGYYSNSELTAAPTQTGGFIPINPLGLIDMEQLNGWLANVTARCSSINRALTGASTVTASPTTTGPYFTSFGSGDTMSYPTWTGLTQYPPPVFTVSVVAGDGASGGDNSASSGSSNASSGSSNSGNGSPTSSAAPSDSSPANHAISGKKGSAGLAVLGMMIGYVVVYFQ